MNRKYYLVYKIENTLNGMVYIGCHVTENPFDSYMGSGTNIRKALKKFGRENFKKMILFSFDNPKEMADKERELVNEEFIARPDTYNIILGGQEFLTTDTVTVKDKNGNTMKVHKTDPRYLSGELVHNTKGFVTVKDKDGNCFNVQKTDTRYLSGELVHLTKGLIVVKDKNGNCFSVKKNDPRYLSGELSSIMQNIIVVKSSTGEIMRVAFDDPRYLSGELVGIWTGKRHNNETKKLIGEANSIHQKGSGNSQYGTCWITKDGVNKKIKKEELSVFEKEGWVKGRKIKSSNI